MGCRRDRAITNRAAEQKSIEIVDAFMDTSFEEEADAAAWLVKRITAALDEVERAGQEAARLSIRRDR
jgi:hypothetical protein